MISILPSTPYLQLWRDSTTKPAVIQNRFYADSAYDVELRAFCREVGIVYTSFWTLTGNPNILSHAAMRAIVKRTGRTAAQCWFRFVQHLGIAPLTGTCSEQHMREDLQISEFALTLDEVRSLAALIGEPQPDALRD